MIVLTDHRGVKHYVAASAIAHVEEAGVSSRWHGIRAYVRLFDGKTVEVQDSAADVARAVSAEEQTDA